MTLSISDRLVQWLRDAHAMEAESGTLLRTLASRLQHYPELRQRIELHVTQTADQARRIEARLQALGSSTSTVQNLIAQTMAAGLATGNALMSDEVIKGLGLSYAFEHMEIASYRALLFAAEQAGDTATAQLCREILPEEEAMAAWLLEHQQALIRQFLAGEQAGQHASR